MWLKTSCLALLLVVSVPDLTQAQEKLEAEGFFVLDKKAMELYLREENNDKTKAEAKMLEDAEYFITDSNLYYDTLSNYGLNLQLRILDFQVLDKDLVSGREISNGNVVNENDIIDNFGAFLKSADAKYTETEYDFAILLTGYNLEDPTAGYAKLGTMCNAGHAYGVVEMTGQPGSVVVLSHEAGHIFGAEHDSDDSVNVMASSSSASLDLNKYKFSSLSATYITDYLNKKPENKECLLETSSKSRTPSVTYDTYTGRVEDVNIQCEREFGVGSSVCTSSDFYEPGGINSDSVCLRIACHTPDDPRYCGYATPAEGMICGPNKSCRKGLCLDDSRSSTANADEQCIFGDDAIPDANNHPSWSCEDIIANDGADECEDRINDKCCATCPKYDTGIEGCRWGDSKSFVLNSEDSNCEKALDDFGMDTVCGHASISEWCCKSCSDLGYDGSSSSSSSSSSDSCSDYSGDLTYNGKVMTCPEIYAEYGLYDTCSGSTGDYCCETCTEGEKQYEGYPDGCTWGDMKTFILSGTEHSCETAIGTYTSDLICTDDTLKSWCCATCYETGY